MAAAIFYVWVLLFFTGFEKEVECIGGSSHDCYKVDGTTSVKGVYFGYIHVQNQTIGSIQFSNNTGTKCVCRFPNSSYTIQNVTYYGDRNIPTIQSFFDPGCRIVSNSGVQRPGYSCRVNITGVNNNFDVNCSNIIIGPTTGPTITSTIDKSSEQTTSPQQTPEISTKTRSTSSLTFTSDTSQNPTSDTSIKSTSKSVSIFTTQTSKSSKHSTNLESDHVTSSSVSRTTDFVTHKRQTSTSNHASTTTTNRVPLVSSNQPPLSTSGPENPSLTPTIKSSVEYGISSTAQSTGEHIETTTKHKSERKSDLKLEIIIPLVLAIALIIFIIAVFICIRKQREKKRVFKYEVSPTPSVRSKASDKEEILKYNNEFYSEHGTKHNILYEGEDYCEHGIFNKAFIETHPEAARKKEDERVYAPTLRATGSESEPPAEDFVLEDG